MSKHKTAVEQFEEFGNAWINFLEVVARELELYKILDWLASTPLFRDAEPPLERSEGGVQVDRQSKDENDRPKACGSDHAILKIMWKCPIRWPECGERLSSSTPNVKRRHSTPLHRSLNFVR